MATPLKTNRIGLELQPYRGGKTTLCAGCGHNAISERIIDAFFEMGVDPRQVIKLSGIGCSSKSPAYFLGGSHGFNAVHGRLPSVGTGATLVARSFSGDKKQLLSLLKAALAHRGTVMLDVISPCVTFNDHEGSTKSYAYVKDHDDPVEEVSFVPYFEDISVDYEPGTTQEVTMHDGSRLFLKKLEEDYDPTDKISALKRLHETARRGEFATGLIYIEPDRDDFLTQLNMVDEPLATLPLDRLRPGPEALEEIMEGLR